MLHWMACITHRSTRTIAAKSQVICKSGMENSEWNFSLNSIRICYFNKEVRTIKYVTSEGLSHTDDHSETVLCNFLILISPLDLLYKQKMAWYFWATVANLLHVIFRYSFVIFQLSSDVLTLLLSVEWWNAINSLTLFDPIQNLRHFKYMVLNVLEDSLSWYSCIEKETVPAFSTVRRFQMFVTKRAKKRLKKDWNKVTTANNDREMARDPMQT